MTSTLRRSNSAANSLTRSDLPWAQRYSIANVSPSLQPSSRKRAVKATVHGPHAVASAPSTPATNQFIAFVTRLRELGWTTGETIDVDYRWAGGSSKRVSDFTAEFLRRNVDVIVTYGAAAAVVQQATRTTPIVLAVASDPGVGSLASRPDGNVTGISIQQSKLISKRLDLLREVVPHLRRLVIMGNAGYAMPVLCSSDSA